MKKHLSLIFLNYLRFFARLQLAKVRLLQKLKGRKLTIVGVTGSAGKSSTISACEAALRLVLKVKTSGGSNSESGIPLNILGIPVTSYTLFDWLRYAILAPLKVLFNWHTFDIYLCEMGVDSPDPPKNMGYLLTILRPDIGIFLNVSTVHSEFFDKDISDNSKDQRDAAIRLKIGQEKAKMIASLPSTGYALLNLNDPVVMKTSQNTLAKKIALKPKPTNIPGYAPPSSFDLSISAAINLAHLFGIDEKQALDNIKNNLTLPPGRSSLIKAINDSTIIDSSYNSSPLACIEMLDVLKIFPSPRIAVLGDMRELGQQAESAHLQIYRHALKTADQVVSVGPLTQKYFGDKSVKFLYWWQADEYIKQHLTNRATILVKGSQNTIYLEELVKRLLAIPADSKQLCRQSPHWLAVKEKFKADNLRS